MPKIPKIDPRKFHELLEEIKGFAPHYTPEWNVGDEKDVGVVLLKIFTHMQEEIISRLNRVPEKNFAAFLDMLGIQLLPAQPSRAPVAFYLSEGAKESVLIPERSQTSAEEIVFETEKNIVATPSKLVKAYSISVDKDRMYESPTNVVSGEPVVPFQTKLLYDAKKGNKEIFVSSTEGLRKEDVLIIGNVDYAIVSEISDSRIKLLHKLEYDHNANRVVEKVTSFELFEGKNLQEHILYLGHKDLFHIKPISGATSNLSLNVTIREAAQPNLPFEWSYWGEDKKSKQDRWIVVKSDEITDNTSGLTQGGDITLPISSEIRETKVDEIKSSRWLRCKLKGPVLKNTKLPVVDTLLVEMKNTVNPDMAFYNDVSLDVNKSFYPFGTRPRQLDTFYIGSQEAFSKKDAKITITINIASEVDSEIPVVKVHGVGRTYEGRLKAAGIDTVGKLLRLTKDELKDKLKEGGTKSQSYYSTKAIKILKAVKKDFYDKAHSSGTVSNNKNFTMSNDNEELILSWEYWDGKGWKVINNLMGFKDDQINNGYDFKETGRVEFPCPEDIEAVKVTGQENCWIRVRIISGDYGKELVYEEGNWVPGQIKPPIISRITISYELLKTTNLEHCLTSNNLEFKDVTEESKTEKKHLKPFQPLADEHQTLYLGFDKKIEKGLSIFFSLEEQEFFVKIMPKIEWYYYSHDNKWVRLEVLDNTQNLTRTGAVEFIVPNDLAKTSKFGDELYWIKAVDIEDKFRTQSAAKVKGIYPNTTFAIQAESIKDELLGSSDGSANQKFQFTRKPVIKEKEEIWVNEIGTLSEEEKKTIMEENGEDSVSEIKDENEKTTEVWVRWQAVEDFFDSESKSRHYVVDRATGEVKFGDGVHGMVPPIGRDNIKATYQVGGGEKGNVGASEISTLKTAIPFVDSVTNPEAAEGGSDTELLESVFERGPHLIKHRDRAVTEEDFERLAKAASSYIARTRCFTTGNRLRIIIIPKGEEDKPMPSSGLLKTVEKDLLERSLNLVSPESIVVQKPSYKEVRVTVDVVPESIDQAIPLEKEIIKRLKEFLHPLTGGPERSGWEFGRDVHISDVYALLEGIKDVDHVEKLMLNDKFGDVKVEKSKTVCSGEHRIRMKLGGEIK